MSDRRVLVAVLATLLAVVVSNNNAGSLAQPAIAEAFGAGPADVGWVVFGFASALALSTAVWGGIAARFGLGPSIAAGIALVAIGSVVAALAPTLPVLIAARVLQGLGAGSIPTLSASIVSRRFEPATRPRALGAIVAGVSIGLAAGPLLGGIALELAGWRGPVAFGILAAPAALLLVREERHPDPSRRLDPLGAVILGAAVVALTFTLNRLPVLGVAGPTMASAAILVLAVPLLVRRSAGHGSLVPRSIVGHPTFRRVVALGAVGMSAFLGTTILVPVAAAGAHGLTGIELGLVLVPLATASALASLQNGRVQAWLGRDGTTILSLSLLAASTTLLGLLGPGVPPAVTAVALALLGIGFGLLGPPLINEISQAFGDGDRPVALGLYNLVFFLGGSAGGAISTALVQSGIELPVFAGRPVAGYSTAELLLAVAPAATVAILLARRGVVARRGRVSGGSAASP